MKILTAFGQVHSRDKVDRRLVSDDVRRRHILPHAELHENVRWHMQCMRRGGGDLGVYTGCRQSKNCVIWIVERMDDKVGGAWMIRIFLEYFESERRRQRLPAESFVGWTDRAEQRQ